MPPERLKDAIREMERRYAQQFGTAVTVSDAQPLPGVEFAYALDISRCIGCRRCVYACVDENNQSRDPQVQWIRVFQMDKEKGVDFSDADPYYQPAEVPEEGHFYVPVAVPAVPQRAVHEGVPDRCHLDRAGRHRRRSTTTGASAAATAWPRARTAPGTSTGASRRFRRTS